jgi:hypothetical protein
VRALLRYQFAVLFKSHRWVFPLVAFVLLISVGGVGQAQALGSGLDWAAAILVPIVALLTRSMLTAEPEAARACVAAAAGPVRAQVAVLGSALAGGAVLALIAVGYELATTARVWTLLSHHPGQVSSTVAAGLGKALICIFVGSAVGALCNRPVIRHQTVALLSTIAAVVIGLLSSVSPANAALSGNGAAIHSSPWPVGVPFLAAAALVVLAWGLSTWLAARRSG